MPAQPTLNTESVLHEARRLLQGGQAAEAAELLLVEGFVKADRPEIQDTYLSLVPPTPTLQKMLAGPYLDLQSDKAATRLRGLTQIAREIARESPLDGVRWMRDPRASQPLIERLADSDKKVAARALFVLMRLAWRYFPDQRARAALAIHLGTRDQEQRTSVIGALAWLRHEEALEPLATLLADGTEQDRVAVASSLHALLNENWVSLHQFPLELSSVGRERWRQRLQAAAQNSSEAVRNAARTALDSLQRRWPAGG